MYTHKQWICLYPHTLDTHAHNQFGATRGRMHMLTTSQRLTSSARAGRRANKHAAATRSAVSSRQFAALNRQEWDCGGGSGSPEAIGSAQLCPRTPVPHQSGAVSESDGRAHGMQCKFLEKTVAGGAPQRRRLGALPESLSAGTTD